MGSVTAPELLANLPIISYEAIADKDVAEIKKMVDASTSTGMFFLDLKGPKTQSILDNVPGIFKTGNEFFNLAQDSEEKIQSLRPGLERGYKALKGLEYYEIARDEFQLGKWTFPATLQPQVPNITHMLKTFNTAAQTILHELCAAVDISIPELSDDPTVPSDTAIKLLFKPPIHDVGNVILPRHTDFGLLTLLWYDEKTTQLPIYDAAGNETDEWEMVPVVDGALLINVADGLAARSGGKLHSTVHRVIAPEGPKRVKNGLVYFLRPYKN